MKWEPDAMEDSNLSTVELTVDQFRARAADCGWQAQTIDLMIKPMLNGQHYGGAFAMGEKGGPHGRMLVTIKKP